MSGLRHLLLYNLEAFRFVDLKDKKPILVWILSDGFCPVSEQISVFWAGDEYHAQLAENQKEIRVYYMRVEDETEEVSYLSI